MQDYELIRRIQSGEKSLLEPLIEKYYNEIFRYCYYRTSNEQAAYDCTQETFLHLLRFLESYTEKRQFKAYLLRIALNVCRDFYRRNNNMPLSYETLQDEDSLPQSLQITPQTNTDNRMVIQKILMSLPEYQQEVIILYYYYGYKLREIAKITGVPLSTVKSRLRQGMEKLKLSLEKEDIYE